MWILNFLNTILHISKIYSAFCTHTASIYFHQHYIQKLFSSITTTPYAVISLDKISSLWLYVWTKKGKIRAGYFGTKNTPTSPNMVPVFDAQYKNEKIGSVVMPGYTTQSSEWNFKLFHHCCTRRHVFCCFHLSINIHPRYNLPKIFRLTP